MTTKTGTPDVLNNWLAVNREHNARNHTEYPHVFIDDENGMIADHSMLTSAEAQRRNVYADQFAATNPNASPLRWRRVDSQRFMLVYQAGIANVFRVQCFNLASHGREAQRVYQGDFRTAESLARGAALAGAIVRTAACNRAGDIIDATWTDNLDEQPFSESFNPVRA